MSFINKVFGKTKSTDRLKDALKKAALNAAYQSDFYKTLLNSNLFVPINGDPLLESDTNKENNFSVLVIEKDDGTRFIPIFSSTEEFSKAFKSDRQYIQLNAKIFFESTIGASYVLNAASDYGKEILAHEAEELITGKIFHSAEEYILKKGTKILISQPSNYPHDLTKQLSLLFNKNLNITAAYLAQIHTGEKQELPHLIIAVKMIEPNNSVFNDASVMLKSTLKNNEIVDFYILEGMDELDGYFNEIAPFYIKNELVH